MSEVDLSAAELRQLWREAQANPEAYNAYGFGKFFAFDPNEKLNQNQIYYMSGVEGVISTPAYPLDGLPRYYSATLIAVHDPSLAATFLTIPSGASVGLMQYTTSGISRFEDLAAVLGIERFTAEPSSSPLGLVEALRVALSMTPAA